MRNERPATVVKVSSHPDLDLPLATILNSFSTSWEPEMRPLGSYEGLNAPSPPF